ncbi:MAG TPA: RdgB/HAM1 family non-canonical purine NTP pyrophosphatase [Steroidobacteraceae bacterium]|nr:RdgB/HAM1 family non-canonical purine NTP pyrophosphatase [Steroidobacteraceae bacterium]
MSVPLSSSRRVVVATGNPGKLREILAILEGRGLEIVAQSTLGIGPPVEDGDSFAANALIKARHAAARAGLPAIADDSGLEVDTLGGRPGIHTARYAGPEADEAANNAKLLAELDGVPASRRGARYRCAMVFVRNPDDPQPIVAEAAWEGRIGFERRGAGGFGYDPLFVVAGGELTAAQMPAAEKNRVSHRGKALAELAEKMKLAGW